MYPTRFAREDDSSTSFGSSLHTLLALRDASGAPTCVIAAWLDVELSTASRNFRVLQRRGLVSRERDPRDRRVVLHSAQVLEALGSLAEVLAPREMEDDD